MGSGHQLSNVKLVCAGGQLLTVSSEATMSRILLVLAAFLLLVSFLSIRASGEVAAVGDSFKLSVPSQAQCAQDKNLELFHYAGGTLVRLARRESGVWEETTQRVNYADSALVLSPVNYNDRGLYEFICTDGETVRLHLEVVDPRKFSVSENDKVHFPCHAVTEGEDVKSVTWKKGGKVVVRVNLTSKKITYALEFDLRVSLPSNWFSEGDFTLTLDRAQLPDQGDYICYIQGKNGEKRRDPDAARLMVQSIQNQTSCPEPGPSPTDKAMGQQSGHHTAWVVTSIVVALCAVAFGVGWWIRSHKSPPGPDGGEAQVETPLVSVNNSSSSANGAALNG